MRWSKPSNALTTNSGVISSDVKGHPDQNRVLSLREIMIIATVSSFPSSDYKWTYEFNTKDKVIRDVLGECIPPLYIFKLVQYIQQTCLH